MMMAFHFVFCVLVAVLLLPISIIVQIVSLPVRIWTMYKTGVYVMVEGLNVIYKKHKEME